MSDAAESRLPVGFGPKEAKYARDHLTYQAREAKRDRMVKRGSLILNAVLGGAVIAGAYGAACVLPLVRVVPVFVNTHTDGTVGFAITSDQQPMDLNQAQIRAWLWQYVLAHDAYSWGAQKYNWDVVTAMSAPDVRKAYQQYASTKNPRSPVSMLGRTGFITLQYDNLRSDSEELHLNKDGTGTYRVSYYRTEQQDGKPPVTTHWQEYIEFTQNYVPPVWMRYTFNPSSLTVTSYAPPEAIGSVPGAPQ